MQNLASIQKRTSPVKFAQLAEKSENGSISNLSTKVSPGRAPIKASSKTAPETSVVPAQLTPRVASMTYSREIRTSNKPPPPPPPRIPKAAPGGQASHSLGFRSRDHGMSDVADDVARFEESMRGLGNLNVGNFFVSEAKQNTYREPAAPQLKDVYEPLDGVSYRLDANLLDAMTPRRNSFLSQA